MNPFKFRTNDYEMYLGEKRVSINKLTPNRWRTLFETIDTLPGLILQVIAAPQENFHAYLISACELAMDEIVKVVAVLSDIDEDYLNEHVGVDELVDYLTRTFKRNNLGETIKNVKSLLPGANAKKA
ncbi:hypothetical protein AB685_14815 [Bacillus sp. LL01]|uniref:hypothetical protein n=1 Tax=Bacillus sp. LL01 TaxID=1665556 RepID=UPI00064D3854|nr:hypothetical protein [Bacillus sp. LL01]KMJ58076.1 hypothetical protein AB685_14815 [Bacillus sp. LL01]